MGAHEQELYIRRDSVADVATQTEVAILQGHYYVDTGATSIESRLSYPGRSECNLSNTCANVGEETFSGERLWNIQKSAEVIVPQSGKD